ncbi:MAG: 4Fe-4S dicluster domain-containing protein [Eggerthellaceae bacterium]|nr:4Fe-4S dicluster domain-containing protein [Eggerthellaceae bacterium]
MTRYGMLIDTTLCTGCGACRAACQQQNNLDADLGFIKYAVLEQGAGAQSRASATPLQCMHCEDAPCAAVCPTGASYVGPDGLVAVEEGKCIGCLYCMAACPYQVRVRNEATGTVDKCRLCAVTTLTETTGCTCVEACPAGARVVGDLDDGNSELVRLINERGASPIAPTLSQAKLYYVR